MTRVVVIDEEAADEADAQARYYATHAGEAIALAFVLEVEAVYRGLEIGRAHV